MIKYPLRGGSRTAQALDSELNIEKLFLGSFL